MQLQRIEVRACGHACSLLELLDAEEACAKLWLDERLREACGYVEDCKRVAQCTHLFATVPHIHEGADNHYALCSAAWVPLFEPQQHASFRTISKAIAAMPFTYAALLHVSAIQWLAPYIVSIGALGLVVSRKLTSIPNNCVISFTLARGTAMVHCCCTCC